MRFDLVFQQSGDYIPFEVMYNYELFKYFVEQSNSKNENTFCVSQKWSSTAENTIHSVHNSLLKVNLVLQELTGDLFDLQEVEEGYLDQDYLNRIHAKWVKTQDIIIDIESLRQRSPLGAQLHHAYPDSIRQIRLADALTKLGLIDEYESINMSIHSLENTFSHDHISFDSPIKWQIIDNPYKTQMVTNNDVTNFNFGYTYLGRQNYDKWLHYDDELKYQDHYNYQTLEFSFNVNLDKPQTIPFSNEFSSWCREKGIQPIGQSIPIGNVKELRKNLHEYRIILYRNIKENNQASIIIN